METPFLYLKEVCAKVEEYSGTNQLCATYYIVMGLPERKCAKLFYNVL